MTEHDTPTVVHVASASPYDVLVGEHLTDLLPETLGAGVERVALVFSADLEELVAPVRGLLSKWYSLLSIVVPAGEQAKTAAVAADCWERLGRAGFTRSDAVVTFGGGATSDLGGFVAATWLRGVRVVHLPTTLLGMVDAAVGGKTGINTTAGKNLVGSFHEPAAVLCDLAVLASLPPEELRSGLGEVVKCGFVADPEILDLVEASGQGDLVAGSPLIRELVVRAVRVKADVVGGDLRETGGGATGVGGGVGREVLNYGHTMGHAIEQSSSYRIRHGEAVAIGSVYAAELGRIAGVLDDAVADRHRTVLAKVGLPTGWSGASYDELRALMGVDKKSRGTQLRFVVLTGLAAPRIMAGPSEGHLRAAYDVMTGASR